MPVITRVTPNSRVYFPGLPCEVIYHGKSGTSACVTIDGKRTTVSAQTVISLRDRFRPMAEVVPPAPKPEKKVEWMPPADRISCRQFFINTLTQSPTISFPQMFDLLREYYPDSKAGSDEKSAKNQFAYYKTYCKKISA